MTALSQNGYTANDRGRVASYTIPGTKERVALRKGDASVVLLDLAGFLQHEVIEVEQKVLDDWGYAERLIRGSSTTLSNHASGTALDVNARAHPLGATGTWTPEQRKRIHARLELYNGVVRWGEDYHGRVDGMHFEINKGKAAVRKIADRVRKGALGSGAKSYLVGREPFLGTDDGNPILRRGDHGAGVKRLQKLLNKHGADPQLEVDGSFGELTEKAVRAIEKSAALKPNGVAGASVWKALDI